MQNITLTNSRSSAHATSKIPFAEIGQSPGGGNHQQPVTDARPTERIVSVKIAPAAAVPICKPITDHHGLINALHPAHVHALNNAARRPDPLRPSPCITIAHGTAPKSPASSIRAIVARDELPVQWAAEQNGTRRRLRRQRLARTSAPSSHETVPRAPHPNFRHADRTGRRGNNPKDMRRKYRSKSVEQVNRHGVARQRRASHQRVVEPTASAQCCCDDASSAADNRGAISMAKTPAQCPE